MNDATAQEPLRESFANVLARPTRPPRVVPVLVVLNIAVFVAMALSGAGVVSPHPAVHVRWGSNFGPLTADHGVPFAVMRAHRNSLLVFATYSFLFELLASGVDMPRTSAGWRPAGCCGAEEIAPLRRRLPGPGSGARRATPPRRPG